MTDRAKRRQRRKLAKLRDRRGALSMMHPSALDAMADVQGDMTALLDHFESDPELAGMSPLQLGAIIGFAWQEQGLSQADAVLRHGALIGEIHRTSRLIGRLDPSALPAKWDDQRVKDELARARARDQRGGPQLGLGECGEQRCGALRKV